MRITGGMARGIPLKLPAKGEIRPATDYLREALFSSLGRAVCGARALDLFAGTGAYGLEALSRGAASCLFVEKNRAAKAVIEANAQSTLKSMGAKNAEAANALPAYSVQTADVFNWPCTAAFDLIFADPPYALLQSHAEALLERVCPLLAPEGLFVLEAPGNYAPPAHARLTLLKRLSKGERQPSSLIFKRA